MWPFHEKVSHYVLNEESYSVYDFSKSGEYEIRSVFLGYPWFWGTPAPALKLEIRGSGA